MKGTQQWKSTNVFYADIYMILKQVTLKMGLPQGRRLTICRKTGFARNAVRARTNLSRWKTDFGKRGFFYGG